MNALNPPVVTPPRLPFRTRLTTRSLESLHGALPLLYGQTDLAQFPRTCAQVLASLVPGESHGVVTRDTPSVARTWSLRPATSDHERLLPVFFENFHEFAPADYRELSGSGEALALSDFVDRAALQHRAIYHDYYRAIGVEDDLSVNVRRGQAVTCIAVLRRARGFRRDEREVMNALCPHVAQAWRNAQAMADLTARTAAAPIPAREWVPEPLETAFGLTPREAEVLLWVSQGKTNPEVARVLGIQTHTVRTHLERVFAKLGVETRHAAGLRAIEVLGLPER